MRRRDFLATTLAAAGASVAGCGRRGYDPRRDDATDRDRIARDWESHERHRVLCRRHPVAPGEVRTTPPPALDMEALAPDLANAQLAAVRLHPRFGPEPTADASDGGGAIEGGEPGTVRLRSARGPAGSTAPGWCDGRGRASPVARVGEGSFHDPCEYDDLR